MELDTGATVSQSTFKRLFPGTELQQSSTKLHSYSGESISVLGQLQVDVSYDDQCVALPLLVVSGKGPNLFGRLDGTNSVNLEENLTFCWAGLIKLTVS